MNRLIYFLLIAALVTSVELKADSMIPFTPITQGHIEDDSPPESMVCDCHCPDVPDGPLIQPSYQQMDQSDQNADQKMNQDDSSGTEESQ